MGSVGDDEKSDGLEIISVGKLYSGSWEKKYWSSSRGKDRYPYPIGYNAVRTQHGITYKMEILEGLKGPLFMISSTDGNSCSGQTPDMAWNRFQKKSTSQVKLLHGKRSSCKIDGVEFFGFKNPFVQRLLRELVANVSESANPITPPSTCCSDVLEKTNQIQREESITKPDLSQHLAKPRVTRKRSRTDKGTNIKSTKAVGGTMINSENANHNSEAPNSTELSTSFSVVDPRGSCYAAQNSLVPTNLESEDKDGVRPSSPHRSSDLHHLDDLAVKVDDLFLQKPTRHSDSIEQAGNVPKDEESLDRSMVVDVHDIKSKVGLGQGEEAFISDNLQNVNGSEICVPGISDIPLEAPDSVKDDITSTQMTDSDTLISESHPEHDNNSLVAHTSSEKNDFDSVKSMMTVLLPRALPLLKTFSRKRKKKVKSSIRSPSDKENTERGLCIDVLHTVDDAKVNSKIQTQMEHFPIAPNKVHIDAFVPDTFDDNDIGCHLTEQQALHADFSKPGPTSTAHPVAPNKAHTYAFIPDTFDDNDIGCHVTEQQALHADFSKPGLTSNAHSVAPNKAHTDAFIPDTFDDNDIGCNVTEQQALHADFAEPVPTSSSQGHLTDNSFKEAVIINAEVGNLLCHAAAADLVSLGGQDVRTDAYSVDQKCTLSSSLPEITANANISGISGSQIPDLKDAYGLEINMNLQNMPASMFLKVNPSHIRNGECSTSNIAKEALEEKGDATDSLPSHLHNQNERDKSEEHKHGLKLQPLTYSNQHLKLIAGYAHPMPIKSVLLSKNQNEIYICALCGIPEDEEGIFFLYKTQMEGPDLGCPSFYGHSSIILPSSRDVLGRNIAMEKSGLQFTPDARFLVLLNSIRTPCCSDGNLKCSCGSCKANSCENNAVKIVQVKGGFVTVVAKLKTTGPVCCILVCEPSTLVAAEESGKLYLWVMNSSWSAWTAEYLLPTPDCIPPCTLDLKKIPKVASLIIGHNGVGDFCLWDIHKHVLVSKISSPNTSVQQIIPVSLFKWRTKGIDFVNFNVNETINEIMDETKAWMTETNESLADLPDDAEDVAIWLLLSGESDQENWHGSKQDVDPTWRLGLLAKHTMIMGSVLDPRAAAVGAYAGHGVIGRSDGLVYIWELSTGINLGNLHHFKGGRMSCIAIDDSGSDVFAVASNEGHLLLYKHS